MGRSANRDLSRNWRSGFRPFLLIAVLGLVTGLAGSAAATMIHVSPSLLNVESESAVGEGRTLFGGSTGDRFTRGYSVENPDGADIVALFTSILYDAAAVQFVDGFAFSIFGQVHPELFGSPTISLQPILDPEPHVVSPADTLFGLNHTTRPVGDQFLGATATGPELALAITFEIVDPDLG